MEILKKIIAALICLCAAPAFSYPKVHIKNNTNYTVNGVIYYLRILGWGCKLDVYKVAPRGSWKGPYRGGCLITDITINYRNNGYYLDGEDYQSKGSVWAYFAIDKKNNGNIKVKHAP